LRKNYLRREKEVKLLKRPKLKLTKCLKKEIKDRKRSSAILEKNLSPNSKKVILLTQPKDFNPLRVLRLGRQLSRKVMLTLFLKTRLK